MPPFPARTAGYRSLEKISTRMTQKWNPGTPLGFAALEALARYADGVTFVGDSTMKEAMLFYRMKGIVIRNGIDVRGDRIDWNKKDRCRARIQDFMASITSISTARAAARRGKTSFPSSPSPG